MKQWEYKIVYDHLEKEGLDELGQHGWELVSYTHIVPGNYEYIFKRERGRH